MNKYRKAADLISDRTNAAVMIKMDKLDYMGGEKMTGDINMTLLRPFS